MRNDRQRLEDVLDACAAISSHLQCGNLDDGLIFDAVQARLMQIGEAIKCIDPDLLLTEPGTSWRGAARMRDNLAHRYFDTQRSILEATVREDLPDLAAAVERLLERVPPAE